MSCARWLFNLPSPLEEEVSRFGLSLKGPRTILRLKDGHLIHNCERFYIIHIVNTDGSSKLKGLLIFDRRVSLTYLNFISCRADWSMLKGNTADAARILIATPGIAYTYGDWTVDRKRRCSECRNIIKRTKIYDYSNPSRSPSPTYLGSPRDAQSGSYRYLHPEDEKVIESD